MNFEYLRTVTVNDSIDVKDIGNCCLQASNDNGMFYYFISHTVMGKTSVLTYGPLYLEESKTNSMMCNYQRFDYNDKKLAKLISIFLNSNNITQAFEVEFIDIRDKLKSFTEYMEF